MYYCIPAAVAVIECYCTLVAEYVENVLQQLMFVVDGALWCCYIAMADYSVDSAENYLMYHFVVVVDTY